MEPSEGILLIIVADQTLVLRIRDVIRRLSMEVDFCKGKVLHGDPADNPRGNGQTLQYYHEDTLKDLTSRNWNPDIESWVSPCSVIITSRAMK